MSTATPAASRYRYFTVPPAAIRLTVDDLTTLLPEGAWTGTEADRQRELALPAAEILESNYPRIRFSRLCDLLPGCVRYVSHAPEWIALPTDRVVLAYKPESRRELIEEPGKPAEAAPEASDPAAIESPAVEEKPLAGWRRLLKPARVSAPTAPPSPEPEKAPEAAPDLQMSAETPPESAPAPIAPAAPPVVEGPVGDRKLSEGHETRLQQAFLTEETLTIQRVVELGAGLPGLQGCVLSRGTESISSAGVPAALDVRALGTGASELLRQMGESSNLKLMPALTLYSDAGPLSFLQRGELSLLVVHQARGFLPGVREKLELMLETADEALRR